MKLCSGLASTWMTSMIDRGWVPSSSLHMACGFPVFWNLYSVYLSTPLWRSVTYWQLSLLQLNTMPGLETLNWIEWCVLYLLLFPPLSSSLWLGIPPHHIRTQEINSGNRVVTHLSAPALFSDLREIVNVYVNRISAVSRLKPIPSQCSASWPQM